MTDGAESEGERARIEKEIKLGTINDDGNTTEMFMYDSVLGPLQVKKKK